MNTQDLSREILSEIEWDKVVAFSNDKLAFEAVKKYILAVAVNHGVFKKGEVIKGNLNFALSLAFSAVNPNGVPRSDEELGQFSRALALAVQLLESGFREIEEIKETKKVESEVVENKVNPTE